MKHSNDVCERFVGIIVFVNVVVVAGFVLRQGQDGQVLVPRAQQPSIVVFPIDVVAPFGPHQGSPRANTLSAPP